MFSNAQLHGIDRGYFIVLQATAHSVTVQSKCTGHQWHICGSGYGDGVILEHRHNAGSPWHSQAFYGCRHNFNGAITAIKNHDRYQLNKNKRHR